MTKEIIRPLLVVGLITYLGFHYYLENYPETKLNNSVNEQNNEILDVKITKIEKVNKKIDSLSQHDFNVEFLYDNMKCHARMDSEENEISSKEFFCKEQSGLEFYSGFPSLLNQKYKYILVNKIDKTKVKDLSPVKLSDLTIQKNLVQ